MPTPVRGVGGKAWWWARFMLPGVLYWLQENTVHNISTASSAVLAS
ncbi:hypothetical protein E2C01_054746 [Portunus trituberculatus]|uniref:Uncharacterized protein n=1 Tax=Portunus trituberculatus TaxID=210409 RepID=A0A5B7GSS3_PORTR|nr:hypothetical protein [Portunus trituberculatus]